MAWERGTWAAGRVDLSFADKLSKSFFPDLYYKMHINLFHTKPSQSCIISETYRGMSEEGVVQG